MAEFRFTNELNASGVASVIDVLRRPRLWIPTAADYPDYERWLAKTEAQLGDGEKRAMLASIGRTPVGAVIYRRHESQPDVLEIRNISVHPEAAGRHFASFLLRSVEVEGATHDYPGTSVVMVDAKAGNPVVDFLAHRGYAVAEVTDLYGLGAGMDVVLTKQLADVAA